VEWPDGSVLGQMGFPSMELPILYALTHPFRRADDGTRAFDPVAAGSMTFEPMDVQRFGAFRLGVQAGRAGGTAPAVFNAANEVAVEAFCNRKIGFLQISEMVRRTMTRHQVVKHPKLEEIFAADAWARTEALRA